MIIERYEKAQQTAWDDFVAKSKNGTFLFSRAYMEYHEDRFEDHSLMVRGDAGEILALLPASRAGGELRSHGGLTYGGFVSSTAMTTPTFLEVFDKTLTFLAEGGFASLVYKSVPYIYHRAPAEEDRYALWLAEATPRRRGAMEVLDMSARVAFQERRTRGTKKAKKAGVEARESTDLAAYWGVLDECLDKRFESKPVHSLAEISLLRERFPGNIRLFAAYEGEAMTAGVLVYETPTVARAQYIASTDKGRAVGALDLVFQTLLDQVFATKKYFDFGTCDVGDGRVLNRGLVEQKEGFGARFVAHDQYDVPLSSWKQGQILRAIS